MEGETTKKKTVNRMENNRPQKLAPFHYKTKAWRVTSVEGEGTHEMSGFPVQVLSCRL
jgi:hypothetical protein